MSDEKAKNRYYKAYYSCSEYESQEDYENELRAIIPDNKSLNTGEILDTTVSILFVVVGLGILYKFS